MPTPKFLASYFLGIFASLIIAIINPLFLLPILWLYVSFHHRAWAIYYEIYKLKSSKVKVTSRKYCSLKELLEDIKSKTILEDIEIHLRIFITNFLDYPKDTYAYILFLHQRITKGWAVSDAWGFNYYLAKVIYQGCEWLKKNKHGCPMACFRKSDPVDETGNHTDEAFNKAMKRWEAVLDSIILTFKIAEKISDSHWHYQPSNKYSKKIAKQHQKITNSILKDYPEDPYFGYVMSKAECKVYEKGWKNLKKYFFNLWD